jgi:hypothetical protein
MLALVMARTGNNLKLTSIAPREHGTHEQTRAREERRRIQTTPRKLQLNIHFKQLHLSVTFYCWINVT